MAQRIYMLSFALSFAAAALCLIRLRTDRSRTGQCLQGILVFSALIIPAYLLVLFGRDPVWVRAGLTLKDLFSLWTFYFILQYAYRYTGSLPPRRALRFCYAGIAAADSALLLSGLFFPLLVSVSPVSERSVSRFSAAYLPLYGVHLLACCLLIAAILFYMTRACIHAPRLYRWKYSLILLGFAVSVALDRLFSLIDIQGAHYDISVISYSIIACLLYLFTFHFKPIWFIAKINSLMVEHSSNGFLSFDYQKAMVSFNQASAALFGLTKGMVGQLSLDQFLSDNNFPTRSEISQTPRFRYAFTQEGVFRHFEVRYQSLNDKKGRSLGSYFTFQEDTEQRALLAQQRHLATHDLLTDIPNRAFFFDQTQQLLRTNAQTRFALVHFDIDNFKIVNELFGSRAGDLALRAIAKLLQTRFATWAYARMETDHFALCIPESELHLQDLAAAVTGCIKNIGLPLHMRASFGIYPISDATVPVEQMCSWASMAAQTIKGSYLDYYAYYGNDLREQMLQEQEIIGEMGSALAEHQFEIFLQPQYNHVTKEIVGSEALVRWNHPERGYISPGMFIPVFEKNGFITQLDQYVWESACQCLRRWADDNSPLQHMPISVNISRLDFYRTDLCNIFIGLIEKYRLPAHLLKLEITESAYIDEPKQVIDAVKKLQAHGFTIQMDDFGSGYSSLNTLKNMPVDILKLDMKFLSGEGDSARGGNILHSIVRMANWINLPVIAEGVETKTQADYLCSIGCEIVQGYYYSKPMPVREFERLYANRTAVKPMPASQELIARELLQDLWNPDSQLTLLFNTVIGAAVIAECFQNNLELLRANAKFCTLCGVNADGLDRLRTHLLDMVHPDDRARYVAMLHKAAGSKDWTSCKSRWLSGSGQYISLDTRAQLLASHGNRYAFYLAFQLAPDERA